jgi:prevent-host-death family protein
LVAESSSQFNTHDAKTNLSRIIERVEHGEEIIISRAGTPVAWVVPLNRAVHWTARGSQRGKLVHGAGLGFANSTTTSRTGSTTSRPISFDHAITAGRLPMIHRDPGSGQAAGPDTPREARP